MVSYTSSSTYLKMIFTMRTLYTPCIGPPSHKKTANKGPILRNCLEDGIACFVQGMWLWKTGGTHQRRQSIHNGEGEALRCLGCARIWGPSTTLDLSICMSFHIHIHIYINICIYMHIHIYIHLSMYESISIWDSRGERVRAYTRSSCVMHIQSIWTAPWGLDGYEKVLG